MWAIANILFYFIIVCIFHIWFSKFDGHFSCFGYHFDLEKSQDRSKSTEPSAMVAEER